MSSNTLESNSNITETTLTTDPNSSSSIGTLLGPDMHATQTAPSKKNATVLQTLFQFHQKSNQEAHSEPSSSFYQFQKMSYLF